MSATATKTRIRLTVASAQPTGQPTGQRGVGTKQRLNVSLHTDPTGTGAPGTSLGGGMLEVTGGTPALEGFFEMGGNYWITRAD